MTVSVAEQLPLRGVPDGLCAHAKRQLRVDADGAQVEVRDRRGRLKLTRVYLDAAEPVPGFAPAERELTFLLGADRRAWATVEQRFGARAWEHAVTFARGGAVVLECQVDGLAVGAPVCWRLTDSWLTRRRRRASRRANERTDWQRRARSAADGVAARWPEFAHALRRHAGPVERRVLVHAAEDLLAGRSWNGPRAFSQVHFGTTKARDDVGKILARSGVELEAQIELGVLRAGRTGLAGPVLLASATGTLDFTGIRGPTDVRLDQPELRLTTTSAVLLVIENRQAAEAASDRWPDSALLWTQGAMGQESLDALGQLTGAVARVVACPDADLGGVRIAEQVLGVAPAAELIDIGAFPHDPRSRWKPDSVSLLGLTAAADGPAGELARACLARGYPVEQELAAIDALARAFRP
jgi:hypothetical protein